MQQDVAENVQKQSQLMGVIAQNQAAYKQAFGYHEWRAACEVKNFMHHLSQWKYITILHTYYW